VSLLGVGFAAVGRYRRRPRLRSRPGRLLVGARIVPATSRATAEPKSRPGAASESKARAPSTARSKLGSIATSRPAVRPQWCGRLHRVSPGPKAACGRRSGVRRDTSPLHASVIPLFGWEKPVVVDHGLPPTEVGCLSATVVRPEPLTGAGRRPHFDNRHTDEEQTHERR
jgi:hypothetical protein